MTTKSILESMQPYREIENKNSIGGELIGLHA